MRIGPTLGALFSWGGILRRVHPEPGPHKETLGASYYPVRVLGQPKRQARLFPRRVDVIRQEAWLFCRTSSGVRLCWELEEPEEPKGKRREKALPLCDVGQGRGRLVTRNARQRLMRVTRGPKEHSVLCVAFPHVVPVLTKSTRSRCQDFHRVDSEGSRSLSQSMNG